MHNISDITIKNISKIEGRANLYIKLNGKRVERVEFQISEYKRFYTWAIRGKNIHTLSQIVSRICGTCSIAHLLCSIEAVENGLGIEPSEQTKTLRKLLMYGLIIRDHALHLYLFTLPDYFYKDSILEFDEGDALLHQLLHDAFALKSAGNTLSTWVGGRAVHAMFPKIGGFAKLPDTSLKQKIIKQFTDVRQSIFTALDIFAQDKFHFNRKIHYAGLWSNDFNFLEGVIKSTHGWHIEEEKYGEHLDHIVIPYSMSSAYTLDKELYMVGSLARLNLNKENLHPNTKQDARRFLELFPSDDIFLNNLAQGIEILHSIDRSLEILESIDIKAEDIPVIQPKKSTGIGLIEAPRGLLFYKLDIDNSGTITNGQIVVPTSQNQVSIEQDVKRFVEENIDCGKAEIERGLEMLIRAYDPCMSCASHFLKVRWS